MPRPRTVLVSATVASSNDVRLVRTDSLTVNAPSTMSSRTGTSSLSSLIDACLQVFPTACGSIPDRRVGRCAFRSRARWIWVFFTDLPGSRCRGGTEDSPGRDSICSDCVHRRAAISTTISATRSKRPKNDGIVADRLISSCSAPSGRLAVIDDHRRIDAGGVAGDAVRQKSMIRIFPHQCVEIRGRHRHRSRVHGRAVALATALCASRHAKRRRASRSTSGRM